MTNQTNHTDHTDQTDHTDESTGYAETRVSALESTRVLEGAGTIVVARLSDGATLRIRVETVEAIRQTAHGGDRPVVAYDVDCAGNRYHGRAASPEQIAAFRLRLGRGT